MLTPATRSWISIRPPVRRGEAGFTGRSGILQNRNVRLLRVIAEPGFPLLQLETDFVGYTYGERPMTGLPELRRSTMPSPYIRRLRLGHELRRLREERGLTAGDVARLVFTSRSKISKIENAQIRPDLADVVKFLELFEVTAPEWERLFRLARDAAEKGWWDKYGMSTGHRERLFASLEAGASSIRTYSQTNFPAILQTPEFTTALIDLDRHQGPLDYRPERMASARLQRQHQLLQADGASYEAVVEESVVYRLAVPPRVMAAQIHHLSQVVSGGAARIALRVLPHDAHIPGGLLPKSAFFLFSFPDPIDQPIALVDTATTDLVLTERGEVARYGGHYARLRKAALSAEDSIAFLSEVAGRLIDKAGSGI